jgi:hypothetical protein
MRAVGLAARIALGTLLVLHGAVHAMGALGTWQITTFEGISVRPNVVLTGPDDVLLRMLGAFWLVAGTALVVAGVAELRRAAWWRGVAWAGVLTSLVVTALWKDDARIGLALNLSLVVLLAAMTVWTETRPRVRRAVKRGASSTA